MVVGVLAAERQVTVPHRIGEDKLCCPEVVATAGVALNATL